MNQKNNLKIEKSNTSKFFLYGIPSLGTNIMMGFADFALATLYILAYQLPPLLVSIALGVGKLTIAFAFFFFGWISDAKYTRWGRRKPFLIIMSPILGISFILLLMPSLFIELSDKSLLFIWLFVIYQLFNISYTCTAPFGAWLTEQFTVGERPKASQFDNTFAMLGTAIMAVFSMLILTDFIDKIQENPYIIPPDFFYSVIIFGILPIILFYTVSVLMPTEPHFIVKSNIFQNLKVIIKNKNYVLVNVMIGIASLAWIQINSLILLFTEVVLVLDFYYYVIGSAIFIIGILTFLYIWRKLLLKFGKKRSVLYIFLAAIVFLPFTLLALLSFINTFIYGILFILGVSGCLAGWYLIQPIFLADIAEDDAKITGELKAGIYSSFPMISLNVFQTLGFFMMGIMLELPEITVRDVSFSIGYIWWGPICSLILIVAFLFSRKYVKLDFEWEKSESKNK